MAGYSGTPLGRKLGFKEDMRVVLINPPRGYDELVAPVPMGVRFSSRLSAGIDMVHVFATEKRRLSEALRAAVPRLKQDGMIWVSWPKKSAKVTTDITEDTIREVAFPLGLVDIKVCAVDEVWSGLKLVIRKALRE
jgi:hypothetical protein